MLNIIFKMLMNTWLPNVCVSVCAYTYSVIL